jgi:hypothetical protein
VNETEDYYQAGRPAEVNWPPLQYFFIGTKCYGYGARDELTYWLW